MIGDPQSNKILSMIETVGMGAETAGNWYHQGVEGSYQAAKKDLDAALALNDVFTNIGTSVGVPPALLAAIASRESGIGRMLDANGCGDGGNAFGICQIDKRFNTVVGQPDPKSQAHILQAANHLKSFLYTVSQDHPNWAAPMQLRGAVAAYNMGAKNVQSISGMDEGSTSNDYSADVWERARFFAGF